MIADVSTVSAAVARMRTSWALIDALWGGTATMREAGETYLPRNPAESLGSYEYRLHQSFLYNGLRKTIDTAVGKPFSTPLTLSAPATITQYATDIDLEGRNLHAFARDTLEVAMGYGISYILVDYPTVPGLQTLADQQSVGARPYWVHIAPQQMLGWRSERINGVETLTQARLLESVTLPDGDWGETEVQQIRVLEPGRYRIYRRADDVWALFDEGPVSLDVVPLVPVYTQRTAFFCGKPPLMDLAWLNLEHWQSSSDQSNILHVARVPILFGAGFGDDEQLIIGAKSAVKSRAPDAKLQYVEHSGAAIGAGREAIQDIEDRMQKLGTQLLTRQMPGVQTATEASIETAESDSALKMMIMNLADALNQALYLTARWEGQTDGGTVDINSDFSPSEPKSQLAKAA